MRARRVPPVGVESDEAWSGGGRRRPKHGGRGGDIFAESINTHAVMSLQFGASQKKSRFSASSFVDTRPTRAQWQIPFPSFFFDNSLTRKQGPSGTCRVCGGRGTGTGF